MTFLGIDIVHENQGKLLSIGPTRPALGWLSCALVNGPDMAVPGPLQERNLSSDSNLEAAWNEGFKLVVDMVDEAHVTGCGLLGFVEVIELMGCELRVTGYVLKNRCRLRV